ncbi:AMIN-like domain-containing (lipo)protein [Vallicoccus soli]|uniref:AMIN-like domain-containing protein n=1 Tax=Vallicoccus soli TaxID=2339232 RepID=A0A3A3Z2U5_9ACTN|nr:hypothetical protein [Vallicoccus soli]RJK94771.1 hypothetical protein D5H78_13130 [Vallicoccus soli]
MHRTAAVLAAAALGASFVATAPAPAAQGAACRTDWGSTVERDRSSTPAEVVGVRAGRHACFDRLVVDLGRGPAAGWWVGYVPEVRQAASGDVLPTRGGASLQVTVHAAAYDEDYRPTYRPRDPREVVPVAGYRTFRQVVWASSWEGDTGLGIGTRARLPFRAFAVAGPGGTTRVVVDVAHTW